MINFCDKIINVLFKWSCGCCHFSIIGFWTLIAAYFKRLLLHYWRSHIRLALIFQFSYDLGQDEIGAKPSYVQIAFITICKPATNNKQFFRMSARQQKVALGQAEILAGRGLRRRQRDKTDDESIENCLGNKLIHILKFPFL